MDRENKSVRVDTVACLYRRERIAHRDRVAKRFDHWRSAGAVYQDQLAGHYRFLFLSGVRVLGIGCGQGDLLVALKPALS